MLLALIKKEIINHLLSLRFAVTFVLTLLLVFVSIIVMSAEYEQSMQMFEALKREANNQLDEAFAESDSEDGSDADRGRDRMDMFWNGKLDPVPRPPLGMVVTGLTHEQPAALLTDRSDHRNISTESNRNPLSGLYHAPDIAYIVSVVLSLLAILFVFDTVSGEKEQGTLRLTLANAVPRHTILMGKWIGGLIVLAAPFVVAFLGGSVYLRATGRLGPDSEILWRLAILLLLALLYVSVFFNVGMFISTMTHRASTALFICLFVWVGWILVVPNVAPVLARIIAPSPTSARVEEQKQAKQREINLRQRALTSSLGELQYGNAVEGEEAKLEEELREFIRYCDQYYARAVKRETDWAQTLGRISPSGCWVYAATSITQTGPAAQVSLDDARMKLQREMRQKFEELIKLYREMPRETREWPPPFRREEVPPFQMNLPDLEESVEAALNDVLILMILNVVFFMLAFMMFLRYDAR